MATPHIGLTLSWRTAFDRLRILTIFMRTGMQRLGVPTGHTKVFAIGFNKTATTSIHKVFQTLGMRALHDTNWRDTSRWLLFFTHQAFSDGPPDDFKALDRRYKGAKFILNTRDLDEWIDSRLQHIKEKKQTGTTEITPEWDVTDHAVKHWIMARNAYHQEVLDYFRDRPDDLLLLNYIRARDPVEEIARFLGKSPKNKKTAKPFQRSTEGIRIQGELANAARIHRCFAALKLPESAWKTDILSQPEGAPPSVWPQDTSSYPPGG